MATPAGEGTSYQGGAGGKFRKKPFKKPQTTPYDRPPTALRGGDDGWVSKMIVDPASKLITAGAHLFFSSMFRKRLPPPPPPPSGTNEESGDRSHKTVALSPVGDQGKMLNKTGKQGLYEDQGIHIKDTGKQKNTTDSTGLSELELMLKQKTFTRSEIDRLTELLHSRIVESSNGGEAKSIEFRPPETVSAFRGLNNFARSSSNDIRSESHLDKHRYHGRVSTAVVNSKVLDDDVATPVELAKAYMGNGSSKVSPSVLGLRSQAVKEEPGALCNSPFAPRSPAMSLVQNPSVNGGVLENGFVTPRTRGRSAIYGMARTPYTRVHPTALHEGNGSIFDGYGGPSASSSTGFAQELVARSVSKDLALKRRSSVLDDEIGSVGPIRRLRQKTNLSTRNNMSMRNGSTPFPNRGTGRVSNGAVDPSTSSKTFKGREDNESMPGTSHTPVPSQSKETARKILQQLQMLSPKEKQFEGKFGALSEKSPSKLMPNMLRGQARRSLEDVDSSKILPGAGYSLECTQKDPLPDASETSSQRQDEENGPKSFNVSLGSLAPAGTSNGTVPFKETVPTSSFSDPVEKQAVNQSPPKKWGFQMSAHEDFFELDDEIHSNEDAASAKLAEEKQILETTKVDSRVVTVTEDKTTSVSEFKAPTGSSEFGKPTSLATSDGAKMVEKNSGFMFSAATAASTSFTSVASVSQSTIIAKNAPDKEPDAHPLLSSSGAKVNEKFSPLNFSSASSVGESVDLRSTPPAEAKQETTNSLTANASGTTEIVPKPADSNNGGIKNTQNPGDTVGRPESSSSLPQSTSSLFTGGSSPSFSSLSDGLLNSTTPSIFSSSLPINSTSNSGNHTLPNPFTGVTFSTKSGSAPSSETSASTSAAASSLLAPAFTFESTSNSTPSTTTSPTPLASAFKFGSTSNSTPFATTGAAPSLTTTPDFKSGSSFMAPSTYSTVSTTSSAIDGRVSTEKEATPGDLPSNPNPFGATSVPMASTGSSIFGFSAGSTSSSSAASPLQGSLFGTSSITVVSSQSMPVFGSSALSSTLGASGSTPFAAGSSIFSSSTSSVFGNATSSSFVFGNNSTSSSLLFSSSTSSNSLFGLSTSTDTGSSSSFGLGTSALSSTGFSFGAPSQAPAFGPSTGAVSSSSFFSFSSAAPTRPMFGSSVVPAFGSVAGGNNGDQMTMAEDSMAEDQVPAGPTPTPPVPVFGQPLVPNPSPSSFIFGQTPSSSSGTVPFQFGGQQSQPGSQNPNPFQPSGSSLDFGGGGSFSLGSGGGGDDKSVRRIVRVKHKSRRK